jgi:hypothetical protein
MKILIELFKVYLRNKFVGQYLSFSFLDLHSELFLFEEWIIEIEEQLRKFNSIKNIEDFQQLLVEYINS